MLERRSQPRFRIALMMERIVGFNHEVLNGVRDFAGPNRGWICHFIDPRPELFHWVTQWQPHGIVAFVGNSEIASLLVESGIPFVDVAAWVRNASWPQVGFDDEAIGVMAASYLMSLGYHYYAFVGDPALEFSMRRRRGFEKELKVNGYSAFTFGADSKRFPPARGWTMGGVDGELLSWVEALPKPVAVFAENDERAILVSEASLVAGFTVPGELAILGVDNDPYLCDLGYPPISSVSTPARKLGFEAAKLLDMKLRGVTASPIPISLPPAGIVQRRSTNAFAFADPIVSKAMRYIREQATDSIDVMDVASHVSVGRRTLERLFVTQVRSSVLTEINRVRLEIARGLLANSDRSIAEIARDSGFRSQSRLSMIHREIYGYTPREYRAKVRKT